MLSEHTCTELPKKYRLQKYGGSRCRGTVTFNRGSSGGLRAYLDDEIEQD